MIVLFPSNPLKPRAVDDHFGYEAKAAKEAGFNIGKISLEVILGGEVVLSGCEEERGLVLYRGWLMKPSDYERMYAALYPRLVTRTDQYNLAYSLPKWYARVPEGSTPSTITLEQDRWDGFKDLDNVARVVSERFGDKSVIVKDYLKSCKHKWYDACFIRDARDRDEIKRVTKNFLDIQGESLTGGLCFREFIKFKQIGVHSKTSMPIINEWRGFMRYGKVFFVSPYWAEGSYPIESPPPYHAFERLGAPLDDLPFVAIDIAEREDDGEWMIVEFNDGGSSGVPEGGDTKAFFKALYAAFC